MGEQKFTKIKIAQRLFMNVLEATPHCFAYQLLLESAGSVGDMCGAVS